MKAIKDKKTGDIVRVFVNDSDAKTAHMDIYEIVDGVFVETKPVTEEVILQLWRDYEDGAISFKRFDDVFRAACAYLGVKIEEEQGRRFGTRI